MMKNNISEKKILISRTDSIGDVVLTLPLVKQLKQKYPNYSIVFLAKNYTLPVLECCPYIDEIANWSTVENASLEIQASFLSNLKVDVIIHVFPQKNIAKAAKFAKIPFRIGTMSRAYHWTTCNSLVWLKRKISDLHEAQLNIKLVAKFFDIDIPSLAKMKEQTLLNPPNIDLSSTFTPTKPFIILHPKSKGSAREWPIEKYFDTAQMLFSNNFEVVLAGTEDELQKIKSEATIPEFITNLCGKLTLREYIYLISQSSGIVAASTGPLHIAASLGIKTSGIYAPMRPIHPGRWAPIGPLANYIVKSKPDCNDCKKSLNCSCINNIEANSIFENIR